MVKVFNDKDNSNKSGSFKGSFKDMMDERKKRLPEFQEHITEHFKHYNGEMVAIITIKEDENGEPEYASTFVGGVAAFESSMRMLEALSDTRKAITNQMAENAAKNPEVIGNMLGDMLSDILKKHNK